MEQEYNWEWFRNEMQLMAERNEALFQPELSFIEKCDSLVGDLFEHIGTCGASNRPVEHVSSILIARAFQLSISAVYLAVSGYPDCVPNLNRTIFEITARFYDIKKNSVAAAYGYLLKGAHDQVEIFKTMLESSNETRSNAEALGKKLSDSQEAYKSYRSLALENNFDPDEVQKKHGKINVFETCQKMGIEDVYRIDFAYMSSHVHERNMATLMFTKEHDDRCSFISGPVENEFAKPMAMEVIKKLAIAIGFCAEVTGDKGSHEKAEDLLKEILPLC